MSDQLRQLAHARIDNPTLREFGHPVVVEARSGADGGPLTLAGIEAVADRVDGVHGPFWYCITSPVKHQITRRLPQTGTMLPAAKILAENATRLIDAMPERPPRPELAARMGISDKTLGNVRAGEGNPTLDTVAAVAAFFKLKPWQLLVPLAEQQSQPVGQSQALGLEPVKLALALKVVEGAIADSGKRVPHAFKATMLKRTYESPHPVTADNADSVQAALAGLLETIGDE